MTDRDTKFAGFAKLLWDEIQGYFPEYVISSWTYTANSDEDQRIEQLIAQRAYDLAMHVLENDDIDLLSWQAIDAIPDLTQWPESPLPQPDAPVEPAPSNDQLL